MAVLRERKALQRMNSYKPARTIESVTAEFGIKDIIKLAGNENRLGCSPRVRKLLSEEAGQYSYYPDMQCTVLRDRLCARHQVEEGQLVFGNGSFELISMVAMAYLEEGDESIIPFPSFGWYTNVTLQMGAEPVYLPLKDFGIDLKEVQHAITDRTKVIWICNPNNPTGTLLPEDELRAFLDEVPKDILVVLDEAYVDFIDGNYMDTVEFTKSQENVILLRTFSKLYGLASFRIGYGIACSGIAEKMNRIRMPINVSFAAQKAVEASLDDEDFKEKVLVNNRRSLSLYYKELDRMGLGYVRSHGNFILIHVGVPGAEAELAFLRQGIMVRNGAEFGLEDWIRVSVGRYEENQKVLDVLENLIGEIRGI